MDVADRLTLRPREAAKRLGVSQKTLWSWTQPRGPIPCVRLGRTVLYPVDALQRWLSQASGSAAPEFAATWITAPAAEEQQ